MNLNFETASKAMVPLTPDRHSTKFWKRFTSYGFAARTQIAPLAAAELARAVHTLPLCFARIENRFYLAGLLSPKPDENWFVGQDGRWLGAYVPACFRGHPFSLAATEGKILLCVNESSGLISNTGGEPLFLPDGSISESVSQVLTFLKEVARNQVLTQKGVDALAESGLIVEWPLKIGPENQDMKVSGVYRIDEKRLAGLSDAAFVELRKTPALAIAYAQVFSMENVRILSRLAGARLQRKAAPAPDLNALAKNDDIFRFS